jgi:hypothetical protein
MSDTTYEQALGYLAANGVGPQCSCARHNDGSVTTFLCPLHAEQDPCLTMSNVTGRRRRGSVVRGTCTNCDWKENRS